MTPFDRKKAAYKLCEIRGLRPDDEVMQFSNKNDYTVVGQSVPRWRLMAEEVERIYEVLQAINETMEEE
jgi:hypothetical protein